MTGIEPLLAAVRFDEAGLVPAVAQDRASGVVRMLGWANRRAIQETAATGFACFWSRSRRALWRKGETSGNVLRVRDVRVDCDGDAVLYVCDAEGPTCHTGRSSCFFRRSTPEGVLPEDDGPPPLAAAILPRLAEVIAARRRERPAGSYVVSLLDAGWPRILEKIAEESGEVAAALPQGDRRAIAHEAADVVFHLLVGLEAAGVGVDDVFAELAGRFGTSGLVEKARRGGPPKGR